MFCEDKNECILYTGWTDKQFAIRVRGYDIYVEVRLRGLDFETSCQTCKIDQIFQKKA